MWIEKRNTRIQELWRISSFILVRFQPILDPSVTDSTSTELWNLLLLRLCSDDIWIAAVSEVWLPYPCDTPISIRRVWKLDFRQSDNATFSVGLTIFTGNFSSLRFLNWRSLRTDEVSVRLWTSGLKKIILHRRLWLLISWHMSLSQGSTS